MKPAPSSPSSARSEILFPFAGNKNTCSEIALMVFGDAKSGNKSVKRMSCVTNNLKQISNAMYRRSEQMRQMMNKVLYLLHPFPRLMQAPGCVMHLVSRG